MYIYLLTYYIYILYTYLVERFRTKTHCQAHPAYPALTLPVAIGTWLKPSRGPFPGDLDPLSPGRIKTFNRYSLIHRLYRLYE